MAEAHETDSVEALEKSVADNEKKLQRINNYKKKAERLKVELAAECNDGDQWTPA